MKKIAILAVITLLAFSSCDSFFTDSMGNSREYDPANINLTTDNVADWVKATVGNPPLATAVTEALIKKLETDMPSWERAIFLEHAARLAMEASGVGSSLFANAAGLLSEIVSGSSPEDLTDLLDKLFDEGVTEAADNLTKLVIPGISIEERIPTFGPEFVDKITPSSMTEAVIVLVLGEMSDGFKLSDLNNLGLVTDGKHIKIREDGPPPSENAIALAAYINLITDHPDKFGSNFFAAAISDILNSSDE